MKNSLKYIVPAGTPAEALFAVDGKHGIVFYTEYATMVTPNSHGMGFSYWNHEGDLILNIEWREHLHKFRIRKQHVIQVQ